MNCADLLCCQYKIFYLLINVGRWSFTQTDKRAGWRKMLLLGLTWLLIMGKNRILIGNGFIKWKLINKLHCISTGLCWFIVLSLTSGKKITNEKVFKYQSAGDKTIEIVESAKLPQLAHHLRPIFGLVISTSTMRFCCILDKVSVHHLIWVHQTFKFRNCSLTGKVKSNK